MSTEAAAIHFDGATLALCDGPELLVYNQDGSPRWKHFCDGILVGVRATPAAVITLDVDGRLTRYRTHDGLKLDQIDIEGGGAALDATQDGIALVRGPNELVLVEGSSTLPLNQGATTAACFGPDRTRIGVGWSNGTFRAFDLSTSAFGEVALGAPIDHVTWSARESWVVAAGPQIVVVSADGRTVQATIPLQAPARHLSAGRGGVFAAAVIGHNQVLVIDLHAGKTQGTIDFRRAVCGTAWGPVGQIAIGLDDADATRLDVFSGASIRTEPHPGRGRNTWNYEEHLERDALRGSAAFAKAGTNVLARYEGPPEDGWSWWQIALIAVLVSTVVCMGCTGCGGLAWYLHSIDVI